MALIFHRAVGLWFLVDVCLNFVAGLRGPEDGRAE